MLEMLLQAMMKQQGGGQGDGAMRLELDGLEAMSPAELAQHTGMDTLGRRGDLAAQESRAQQQMVMDQLAQAQEFGRAQNKNYGSVAGNVIGGVGDIIRGVSGGLQGHQLRGQQAELLKQGQAARSGWLDKEDSGNLLGANKDMAALKKALLRQQQQTSDASLLSPLVPNSFGG